MRLLIASTIIILLSSTLLYTQTRIAVLPFENNDGNVDLNIYSYDLQEALNEALLQEDLNAEFYYIVPLDSVEIVLDELNIDPSNPQYESDLWKAVQKLNIKKVILGNFNYQAEQLLINVYIYDTRMKMRIPNHQAKDIFIRPEECVSTIPLIINSILPGLKK